MKLDPAVAARLVRREGRALLVAAEREPAATVPTCPGWTMSDLVGHVGEVWRFVVRTAGSRSGAPVPAGSGDLRPDTDTVRLRSWARQALEAVTRVLSGLEPDEPVWTWVPDRVGAFYHRRMVHETTVHRVDAETATGTAAAVDVDVAVDGVDELVEVGMRHRMRGPVTEYPAVSVLLEQTDGPGRWRLFTVDGVLQIARGRDAGDRADAVVRGPAEELYLGLWGRPTRALSVSGDPQAWRAWRSVAP